MGETELGAFENNEFEVKVLRKGLLSNSFGSSKIPFNEKTGKMFDFLQKESC